MGMGKIKGSEAVKSAREQAYLCLLGAALFWGAQPVMLKILLEQYSAVTVVWTRCMLMTVIYFAMLYGKEGTITVPSGKHLYILAGMGFAGIPFSNVLQFQGLIYSTAFHCTLFYASVPVIISVLAYFLLKEVLTGYQWLGILGSFMGLLFVLTGGDLVKIIAEPFNFGDVLYFLSEIGWAMYVIGSRKVMQAMPALSVTAWATLLGTIMLTPYAWGSGQVVYAAPTWPSVYTAVYLIFISGITATLLWNMGVKEVKASQAAIFSNLTPVTGLLLGSIMLGETFGWAEIGGMAAVCGGVYLLTRYRYGAEQ